MGEIFQKMIKINIVGDISLNNIYEKYYQRGVCPFKGVEHIFQDADLNIGNLECLCSTSKEENKLKQIRLRTSPETLNLLKPLKFNILNLAHNHIYDMNEVGIKESIDKIIYIGSDYIGYSTDSVSDSYVKYIKIKSSTIAIITAIHKDTNLKLPDNVNLNIPFYNVDNIVKLIKDAKRQADFITLYLHWGGKSEKGFMPDWYEIVDARTFIDNGADIVVGGHSHTVQPYEKYNDKYIFYSIGNFCFDDVISDGIIYPIGRLRKRRGLILSLKINGNRYSVEKKFIKNTNGIITGNSFYRANMSVKNLLFKILKTNKVLWRLYFAVFRKLSPFYIFLFEDSRSFLNKIKMVRLTSITKQLKR